MNTTVTFRSTSAEETEALGRRLANATTDLIRVALDGPLGSGKTQFARGFVQGVDAEYSTWVSSPTYAICNTYPTSPPVHHLDLYRLSSPEDLEGIGYYELDDGHLLIEWAERIAAVAKQADVVVTYQRLDGDVRVLSFTGQSTLGEAVVQALADESAT